MNEREPDILDLLGFKEIILEDGTVAIAPPWAEEQEQQNNTSFT